MSTCKFCGVPEARHGTCCGDFSANKLSAPAAPVVVNGVEYVPKSEMDAAQAESKRRHDQFCAETLRTWELAKDNAMLREALRMFLAVPERMEACPAIADAQNAARAALNL